MRNIDLTEKEKAENLSVGIDARMRVHSISEAKARSQYSGSVLGLMMLDGRISRAEMEGGFWYGMQMARYYALTGIPFPSPRAQELFRIGGFDGEVSSRRAEETRKQADRIMRLEGALLRCQNGPQVKTTVFNTCVLDFEGLRTMPEPQLGYLKRGLREIIFVAGLQEHGKSGSKETG